MCVCVFVCYISDTVFMRVCVCVCVCVSTKDSPTFNRGSLCVFELHCDARALDSSARSRYIHQTGNTAPCLELLCSQSRGARVDVRSRERMWRA